MEQDGAAKRRRLFEAEELQKTLRGFYSALDHSFLWDTKSSSELPFPTRYGFGPTYTYVGRRKAQDLYGKAMAMHPGAHMQVLGAKGSGKSTVVRSMAGFLQGSGKKRVVYLIADRFAAEPEAVLLEALLMSCREEKDRQELLSAKDVGDLIFWCRIQPRGSLLFVVDDWDILQLQSEILAASSRHMLVMPSSAASRSRQIWSMSDKRNLLAHTVLFDGPFNADELQTWIGQSKLTDASLKRLDRLTGGMPRLLSLYEQANGDEAAFEYESQRFFEILHEFFLELETVQELRAAVELVTEGRLSPVLSGREMTCFYQDERTRLFHVLSPHLRSFAERYLMLQNEGRMLLVDMQTWIGAVRVDLYAHRYDNPARVAWMIEGITIAMIMFKRKLFEFKFKHCTTYEKGKELVALQRVLEQQLEEGLLLMPAALSEKAVDLIYARLVGDELVVRGVQITIAQWKAKGKVESYQVWQKEILPKWYEGSKREVSEEFYYVMPEGVKLTDVNDCTRIRSFQAIDPSLAEFDDYLLKEEPKDVIKGGLRRTK